MQASDFLGNNNQNSENNSKAGLFIAVCPFPISYDEELEVATITGAGTGISLDSHKINAQGNLEMTFNFTKGEKERSFKLWENNWDGREEGVQKSIGIRLITLVGLLRGKELDLGGADNFEFNSFEDFANHLLSLPGLDNKICMALEFSKTENTNINFRLASLIEEVDGKRVYHPNMGSSCEDFRVDLIANKTMKLVDREVEPVVQSAPAPTTPDINALLGQV